MAETINRMCRYCGEKLKYEIYGGMKKTEAMCYCDNDNCPVKPCTDSTRPSRVYFEILAISKNCSICEHFEVWGGEMTCGLHDKEILDEGECCNDFEEAEF